MIILLIANATFVPRESLFMAVGATMLLWRIALSSDWWMCQAKFCRSEANCFLCK